MAFPYYKQHDQMDCGPTCLRMICKHFGKSYSLQFLRERSYIDREGVSLLGISEAAESVGLRTLALKIPFTSDNEEIASLQQVPLPCIAHVGQNHFLVVYKVSAKHVWVSDPAAGKFKLTRAEFERRWISDKVGGMDAGVLLLMETTPDFHTQEEEKVKKTGFAFLFKYILKYKGLLVQLFIGLLMGSLLQLIFPFLTQAIVDFGIENQDLNFIYIILAAQLMLFSSQTMVSFIRSWILLHIGSRVNISLISDFLAKLMRLPISYFDTKMTGDLLQRIQDHYRIESFLTSSTLSILFSVFNLIVFGSILLIYNELIFFIFLASSILYVLWVVIFLKKRKDVDYKRFAQLSDNQSKLIQLITGMQEIKMQNCEKQKRWEWERIQARLFRISIQTLAIDQYQEAGGTFINELKNIFISFIAAKAVIEGDMTLGMMLAVQYIIGQLNAPLQQMIGFIRSAQDAKISLERLGEIHEREDEENPDTPKVDILPENRDLVLDNVSFRYNELSDDVLKDVNLVIPEGKITAIVGTSGSGKTTLLKLLLKFYLPTEGELKLGDIKLDNMSSRMWRGKCGVVMQDGFIFSDTIANNIGISDDKVDKTKLLKAVKVANIQDFVETLPLTYNTKIGAEGNGLSMGQKQRLLIARSVYKDPEYIFFDEATNSLDANNEKVIMENLEVFFENKTVVVVAHRLSTVKNADQIIVLEKGKLIEQGNHKELVAKKGAYFELVRNQLELGN